jgi:hypothetical protein
MYSSKCVNAVILKGLKKLRREGEVDFLDKNKQSAHKGEKESAHREHQLVNEVCTESKLVVIIIIIIIINTSRLTGNPPSWNGQ